jgi:hypothetical protein
MGRHDDLVRTVATPVPVHHPPTQTQPDADAFRETDKNQHKGGRDTANLGGALERGPGFVG